MNFQTSQATGRVGTHKIIINSISCRLFFYLDSVERSEVQSVKRPPLAIKLRKSVPSFSALGHTCSVFAIIGVVATSKEAD